MNPQAFMRFFLSSGIKTNT